MKNMKAKTVLMLLVGAISILPGCGKKNNANDDPGVPAVPTSSGIASIGTASGGCASVSYNSAATITFYGTLSTYSTGLVAQMPAYGYGASTGGYSSNYTRTNVAGDSLNVYVNGNQAYAVVTLGVSTVNAIVMSQGGYGYGYGYGTAGTAQVCGLDINANISASPQTGAGYSGTITGGLIRMWSNGRWITFQNGQYITL